MWGYVAFEQYEDELLNEIRYHKQKETVRYGRLFLLEKKLELTWAQLSLPNIQKLKFQSIQNGAAALKEKNLFWGCGSHQNHRRNELIREALKLRTPKELEFLQAFPNRNYGFWYLVDEHTLYYSEKTGLPFPLTEIRFRDNSEPPSRAYTKLQELFTLHLHPPQKKEFALDLGACPGGWTWLLLKLGCRVLSVDKAELDPRIVGHKYLKKDAFKLNPKEIEKPDWLFSDIICEPPRLFELVQSWAQVHPQLKMVCTIKYKGHTDFATTDQFRKMPGSKIIHLNCNKHEVTWLFPGVDTTLALRYP